MPMTRDQLREAVIAIAREKRDTVIKPVPTPEWPDLDGHVYVRSMSVLGREQYLDSIRTVRPREGAMPEVTVTLQGAGGKLAAATMCTHDGELLFTEEDCAILNELSAVAMDRVIDVASELNELDEKAAKAKIEASKNASALVAAAAV